jgi:hypothetical protein
VRDINSARNGLFAEPNYSSGKHAVFLHARDACIMPNQESDGGDKQTPNFAMNTNDIDPGEY